MNTEVAISRGIAVIFMGILFLLRRWRRRVTDKRMVAEFRRELRATRKGAPQ